MLYRYLKYFKVVLVSFYCSLLFSQSLFVKSSGDVTWDILEDMVRSDSSAIITGWMLNFSTQDRSLFLGKIDRIGNLIWAKAFGDTGIIQPLCIEESGYGGYITAGYTSTFAVEFYDILLTKFDSIGEPLWAKVIGGSGANWAEDLVFTYDGGYLITGYTWTMGADTDDIVIAKFDSTGDCKWFETVGDVNYDEGKCVIRTVDSGYLIGGITSSFGTGDTDIILIKIDSIGNILWGKTVGSSGEDIISSIIQTPDSGYILAGYKTISFNSDIIVVKLNSSGNLEWAKTLYGNNDEVITSIIHSYDGNYILAGYTNSVGSGGYDALLVKMDIYGNLLWSYIFGGAGDDQIFCLIQTDDTGYEIGGTTSSFNSSYFDFLYAKVDSSGSTCMGNYATINSNALNVNVTDLMVNPYFPGYTISACSLPSLSIAIPETTLCEYVVVPDGNRNTLRNHDLISYLPIFKDKIRINFSSFSSEPLEVSIYDLKGSFLYKKRFEHTPRGVIISGKRVSDLPAGVYFIFLKGRNKNLYKMKFLKSH